MSQNEVHVQIDPKPLKWGILLAVLLILFFWLRYTPAGILDKADAIGYAVCHRIASRSFHIGERQFPLCVRCSGQYLGALFGITFLAGTSWRKTGAPPRPVSLILFIFLLAYIIDGVNSYLHLSPMMEMFSALPRLYTPSNWLRLLTGSGMGFSIGVVLFIAFNRTIWSSFDRRPVIKNTDHLGVGLFLLIILDLLILTEKPFILYPLSILSALSVVFMLTIVYSLVITMIFHRENQYTSISQLSFPLVSGFFIAILQLAFMDALRYLITGTWEGFQL